MEVGQLILLKNIDRIGGGTTDYKNNKTGNS